MAFKGSLGISAIAFRGARNRAKFLGKAGKYRLAPLASLPLVYISANKASESPALEKDGKMKLDGL